MAKAIAGEHMHGKGNKNYNKNSFMFELQAFYSTHSIIEKCQFIKS